MEKLPAYLHVTIDAKGKFDNQLEAQQTARSFEQVAEKFIEVLKKTKGEQNDCHNLTVDLISGAVTTDQGPLQEMEPPLSDFITEVRKEFPKLTSMEIKYQLSLELFIYFT